MQGIAVAISPAGVAALLQQQLGSQIAAGLQQLNDPDSVPDYEMTQPPWSQSGQGESETWSNYVLNLTNGSFTTFDPAYASYTQTDNAFAITISAPTTVVSYTWDETCQQTVFPAPPFESGTKEIGPTDYPYTQSFSTFDIYVTAVLAYSGGEYTIQTTVPAPNTGTETATIPSQSVLNTQASAGCVSTTASAQAKGALDQIDYQSVVSSALSGAFATIPATGVIGAATFQFEPSSTPPVYPTDGGVQLGVTGDVEVNGEFWSQQSTPPADVPIPDIPSQHVAYNVQDYMINGLFWAYTQVGVLNLTLTQADLPSADQYVLDTSSYSSGPLSALDQPPYANQQMSAAVSPLSAPTIVFQDIYVVTSASITSIQAALTNEGVWTNAMHTALSDMENLVYINQDDFQTAVEGQGSGVLAPYVSTVLQYSTTQGGVLSQAVQCILSVLLDPPVEVLTFDVSQQFVMQDIGLGVINGDAQSLTFAFAQPTDASPQSTFVSSILPGVTADNWWGPWFALQANWNTAITGVGQQGIPLPRMQGFDLLAENAQVMITPPDNGADGYATVLANIEYTGDS